MVYDLDFGLCEAADAADMRMDLRADGLFFGRR
jgi:hypothetical protein